MNAPESAGKFDALRFEAFTDLLRLCSEGVEREANFHRLRQFGILKAYYEAKLVLAVCFHIPYPPHEFCFVFARVPSRSVHRECQGMLNGNIRKPGGGNVPLDKGQPCVCY